MSSAPTPQEIARDARWLAQALDPSAGQVRLIAMDRDSYRAASFLDDRDAAAAGRCADRALARRRGRRSAPTCATTRAGSSTSAMSARRSCRGCSASSPGCSRSASRACCATSPCARRRSGERYLARGAEAHVAHLRRRRDRRASRRPAWRQRDRARAGPAGRARALHVRDARATTSPASSPARTA